MMTFFSFSVAHFAPKMAARKDKECVRKQLQRRGASQTCRDSSHSRKSRYDVYRAECHLNQCVQR